MSKALRLLKTPRIEVWLNNTCTNIYIHIYMCVGGFIDIYTYIYIYHNYTCMVYVHACRCVGVCSMYILHKLFHISSLPPPPHTSLNPTEPVPHRRETGQSWGWFIASRLPNKTEEVDHGQGEWGGWCQNPRKAQAQPERWRWWNV